jgi:hypothetical protein
MDGKKAESLEELVSEKVLVVAQAWSPSYMKLSMSLMAKNVEFEVEYADKDDGWTSVFALNKQLGGQLQFPIIIQVHMCVCVCVCVCVW